MGKALTSELLSWYHPNVRAWVESTHCTGSISDRRNNSCSEEKNPENDGGRGGKKGQEG